MEEEFDEEKESIFERIKEAIEDSELIQSILFFIGTIIEIYVSVICLYCSATAMYLSKHVLKATGFISIALSILFVILGIYKLKEYFDLN